MADSSTKQPSKAILSTLRFATDTRPKRADVQSRSPRDTIVSAIDVQLALVEGDLAGKPYQVTKQRSVGEGDAKKIESVVTSPRRTFWQSLSGDYLLSVTYGGLPLEFTKGHTSVVAGANLDTVKKTFTLLRDAAMRGELDVQAETAAKVIKGRRQKVKLAA